MAKRVWRGKDVNHLTVGNGKQFDHTTIQAALDAVETAGDAAADNLYAITVAPGVYESEVSHNVSYTIVTAEVPHSAILQKTSGGTGGAYSIGTDTAGLAEYIVIENMVFNNQLTGNLGPQGGPPEGALYVGGEDIYDTDLNWDMVHLWNNRIIGSHDGLQIFGQRMTGRPGRLFVQSNYIESCHDAVTLKNHACVMSSANQVYVVTAGDTDYLPSANDWKTTGFHFRTNSDGNTTVSDYAFWDSNGDQVWMDVRANVGGSGQDRVAGVLAYNPGSNQQIQLRFRNTAMRIDYDADYDPAFYIAAVHLDSDNTQQMQIRNLAARIHQRNTGSSAPSTIYGVMCQGASTSASLRITDSEFDLVNDKGGGTTVCFSADANATIEYNNIIENAATEQSGAGTFTKLTPMT